MVQRLTPGNRISIIAGMVVLLAACATQAPAPTRTPPQPAPTQTVPSRPAPRPVPPASVPQGVPAPTTPSQPQSRPPSASVTLALQDEAQRAATAGDLPKAIQILERAIRIEPDRAELWLALARAHLKEGDAAQAEQFARKALQFTRDQYDLEQQAWVVIADARAANR
jgi:cytochrome c-type biogenesis protein CcmH/NrfG